MTLQYWADCLQVARDFAGDFAGDFDIVRLANCLFDYDAHTDTYVEREYTEAEIQACDVTSWQDTRIPTEDSTLLYERWFQSNALGPVYVGAWENPDGHVSLTLATVRDGGDDMWDPSATTVADTDRPSTWGELDRAYGSRAEWESDLATVERLIRES
jgi:hypothetical protein